MFGKTQLQSVCRSLIVPAFLFGVWGFGIGAMMLGSAYASQSNGDTGHGADYRQQPSSITYVYQDASGKFTVYVRGTKRSYDNVDDGED